MRQTLFYLPTEIFGIPLFGSGILFWAILLAGLFAIVKALLTKGKAGDAVFYVGISILGLFLVRVIGERVVEANGFPIRGYGVFLMLAIVCSTWLTARRGKKLWNYPADEIISIVFVGAICGILGARLFYVLQYWRDMQGATMRETLINALDITSGGLVVYGSIIGGLVGGLLFVAHKKRPVLATFDLFAPSFALGIAIGRIGCLMNGCCFGGLCDLPWAITFPEGSPAYVQQTSEGVISLYGITLQDPDANRNEKGLFSLKSKHVNLASETPCAVTVASVDPGSAPEQAGVKPGARICQLGLVPKGLLAQTDPEAQKKAPREIRRFEVKNNAQVFYFFLNIWKAAPDDDVMLVLQDPKPTPGDDATSSAKSPSPSFRNVVFHPVPAVAKPVHPTQIYSSLSAFVICCLLILLSRFVKRDGLVGAGLLILYPINRFCLELIRTDEESFCGSGLTVSQCVSLAALAVGIGLAFYCCSRPSKRALDGFFVAEKVDESAPKESDASQKG